MRRRHRGQMSMVDVLLMHSLLEALPQEACLVLVGDPDQLPSVGAGSLFSDLIRSGIVPSVCLTEFSGRPGRASSS